jgi:hypothetical protein
MGLTNDSFQNHKPNKCIFFINFAVYGIWLQQEKINYDEKEVASMTFLSGEQTEPVCLEK